MADADNIFQTVREDDFVEYYLFPHIESKDVKEQENILSSILAKANKVINKYTTNFLWHKDEFKLSARTSIYNTFKNVEEIDGKRILESIIFNQFFMEYYCLMSLRHLLFGISHT